MESAYFRPVFDVYPESRMELTEAQIVFGNRIKAFKIAFIFGGHSAICQLGK